MAPGPHPRRELSLTPRLGFARPRLGCRRRSWSSCRSHVNCSGAPCEPRAGSTRHDSRRYRRPGCSRLPRRFLRLRKRRPPNLPRKTHPPVVRRVARRRPHRGARARHPAGDRRPGAVGHRRAAAGRHRARSRAGGNGLLAREVHPRRLTPKLVKPAARCSRRIASCSVKSRRRYGVPPRIIVTAIWGIESNFGGFSGVRPTIAALATLAWDPRRSAFFRGELFDALEILNRGDIESSRHARLVGGRHGPGAVHAVELPAIRRGLRRRRPPRHLVDAGRRVRVDRELPEGHGWSAGRRLGTRGEGLAGGRAAHCQRRRAARRHAARRRAT